MYLELLSCLPTVRQHTRRRLQDLYTQLNYIYVNVYCVHFCYPILYTKMCVRKYLQQRILSWCVLNYRGGSYITSCHKGKLLPSFLSLSNTWINLLTTAGNLLQPDHSQKMVFGKPTIKFCSGERFNAASLSMCF